MAANAPAGQFMFVEYSKPAEAVKGQKRRRGGPSEVRAHITKNYHRALRVKRLQSLKKGEVSTAQGPNPLTRQDSSEDIDEEVEEVEYAEAEPINTNARPSPPSTTISPPSWRPTPSTSPCTTATSWDGSPDQSALTLPVHQLFRLQTLLGEGRIDPFNALPTPNLPTFAHRVLDHALVHSWPATVPFRHSHRTPLNPVNSSWLKLAMDHPVALHAFLYATSFHILCKYEGREVNDSASLMRLSHKVETIKLVNEQLQGLSLGSPTERKGSGNAEGWRKSSGDGRCASASARQNDDQEMTKTMPTDALIMAIAILSIHSQRDETVYPKVHAISPMAKINNLDIYGAMVNDEKHIQGIMLLVSRKGGLDEIECYGMADTLRLCDLYFASKYACRPTFPLRTVVTSLVVDGRHVLDPAAIDLDSKLGAGFRYLRHSSAGQQLLDILDAFSEITVALDHHVRGGSTAPELVDLAEIRNCTQHRLLSQMPNQPNLSDPELCVHHAVRLATLIFSEMVILPLPPPQRVKPRLALMLQQTLEACHLLRCWELHNQVLLWALTLGAIAANYTPLRSWYLDQLQQETSLMRIENWLVLELICSSFLWWKPICSDPLRWVWNEMFAPMATDLT